MVKLRLAKQGRKKLPIYKIVAADERARRDGRFIEALGQYRPKNETGKVQLNEERVMYWLSVGAQPTDTMRSILSHEGILLKWHLQKKKIDPARASEIFNTWKAQKETTITNKLVSKKEAAKKKKADQDAEKASAAAAKVDGYYKNPKITIPFPPEAVEVKNTLDKLGMQEQTQKFVETLNRGAEEAAKKAAPIFIDAITKMSIGDGFTILNGKDTAATSYLKGRTSAQLMETFRPIIKEALQKVEVTKYWTPLITAYDKVPFVKKQNPDLEAYVTQKAMEGLFLLIAEEEMKIRKDPAARVSDILKKVFGNK